MVPAGTSRTTMSDASLPSPSIRLVAEPVRNATRAPSAETSGSPSTPALAFTPAELTETSVTAPDAMSLRKTSLVGVGVRGREVRRRGREHDVAPVGGDRELDVRRVLGVHVRVGRSARRRGRGQPGGAGRAVAHVELALAAGRRPRQVGDGGERDVAPGPRDRGGLHGLRARASPPGSPTPPTRRPARPARSPPATAPAETANAARAAVRRRDIRASLRCAGRGRIRARHGEHVFVRAAG